MFRLIIMTMVLSAAILSSGCGKGGEVASRAGKQKSSEEGMMNTGSINENEMAVIKKTIEDSIGWALNKDKELLFSVMLQDSSFFIYHPDNASTITGFEAFRSLTENVFMNDAFKATGFDIKDLRINVSNGGNVAWWSCMLDDFGEWDGRSTSWVNARWTGVMEKLDGRWQIAQMHFSFGTDAEKG